MIHMFYRVNRIPWKILSLGWAWVTSMTLTFINFYFFLNKSLNLWIICRNLLYSLCCAILCTRIIWGGGLQYIIFFSCLNTLSTKMSKIAKIWNLTCYIFINNEWNLIYSRKFTLFIFCKTWKSPENAPAPLLGELFIWKVISWNLEIWKKLKTVWNWKLCLKGKYNIANILVIANHRVKGSEILTQGD